jgi:hypothetical protein
VRRRAHDISLEDETSGGKIRNMSQIKIAGTHLHVLTVNTWNKPAETIVELRKAG